MNKDASNFEIFGAKNVAAGSIYMVLFSSGTHPTKPCFHKSDAVCVYHKYGCFATSRNITAYPFDTIADASFADDGVLPPGKMDEVELFV